jgi:hypothetical protein
MIHMYASYRAYQNQMKSISGSLLPGTAGGSSRDSLRLPSCSHLQTIHFVWLSLIRIFVQIWKLLYDATDLIC